MSRLYTCRATLDALAVHFRLDEAPDFAVPSETIEGNPGMVVIEREGERVLRLMRWGFPRLDREMIERGDPPGCIGLVADLTNPMWDKLAMDRGSRCLIPITHFANPDGEAGAKTRTWFSVKDRPILAWAGFCRDIPEVGPVYAGMTMEANAAIPPTNDRMPVLLEPAEYGRWLHGGIRDVIGFQFRQPLAAARMVVWRTDDRWRSGKPPTPAQMALF